MTFEFHNCMWTIFRQLGVTTISFYYIYIYSLYLSSYSLKSVYAVSYNLIYYIYINIYIYI